MSVPEEQMMAAMAQEAPPVNGQPEVVGGVPAEQVPEEVSVADDVPRDVEEGAFVINAPAAEFMGWNDLADMLLNAMKKARQLGIDIDENNASISDEDIVNLLVSKGEVIIPPTLAKIIGYDKLNKINERGQAEVKRRQEVAAQEAPPQQPAPGQEIPIEQLVAQQGAMQGEPQMMATGGEATDTRRGYMDIATSPFATKEEMDKIVEFAEGATQDLRKSYGTKALAVDNELDAYRHLLGASLVYKRFAPNVADSILDLNEVKGIVGDYLGSMAQNAASAKASRDMDYHNNNVAGFLVSQIPMDKLMQMDDNAMKFYVDAYFKEVRAAMQDGSIEAIDPRMVPMFSPAGNENYEQLQPEVDTKSLYLKGPDGNWMENPNHPDVKARQKRAQGTASATGERTVYDEAEAETLINSAMGMFGNFDKYKENKEPPTAFFDALQKLLLEREGIVSETDVGQGSTQLQRGVSEETNLTPERAQQLWLNFPTIRNIILTEQGQKDQSQRIETLDKVESLLKQQLGSNAPTQNPAVSVDEAFGDVSMDFEAILKELEGGPRVVSETNVERGSSRRDRSPRRDRSRKARAEGTKSYDGERQFLMPPKEAPSGDPRGESRSITQGMLEKGIIGDAVITPRDSLPPSMPMEIERMEPSTGGIVKPEHRDLPKILTGEQFLQMKKQVVGYISNNEVSKEELDNMLSMMRGMTSDEEFMRSIEIERGDPIVGDTPILSQFPQNQFYDEEDARRIQDYNDRRDEVIESI